MLLLKGLQVKDKDSIVVHCLFVYLLQAKDSIVVHDTSYRHGRHSGVARLSCAAGQPLAVKDGQNSP